MVAQTKVFVGSLPQGSKPEELRQLFERYGEVTECDIMNRCGFVHMATEDQAADAIRGLQNTSFNGVVITVEKGRIKERAPRGSGMGGRGPPGAMRGGMRNGMSDMQRRPGGGGPMRGPMGGARDAPYMRDRPPMRGGGGMGMRNGMGGGGGYSDAYPDDRYNGYGGDDRGFGGMMDRRTAPADVGYGGRGDMGYGSSGGMYADDRRGGYGLDDRAPIYPDERAPIYPDDRASMYPNDRDMMDRRGGGAPMGGGGGYDRVPAARPAPIGNGDMYSRRSPPAMRGGGGYGDRDPYQQQYSSMGGGRYGASTLASERPSTRVLSNITLLGERN